MVSWSQEFEQNPIAGLLTCYCCGIICPLIIEVVFWKWLWWCSVISGAQAVQPGLMLQICAPTTSISINRFLNDANIPSSIISAASSPSRKSPAAASQTRQSTSEPGVVFTFHCVHLLPQSVRKRHISVVVCTLQFCVLGALKVATADNWMHASFTL